MPDEQEVPLIHRSAEPLPKNVPADNYSIQGPPADVPRERRYVFVQLLFSLTAAEIARQLADLYMRGYALEEALPTYAHLLLASAVIITSWVGWTASEASRGLRPVSVFSWEFFVLLIDVAVVVLYFFLVRSAEMPGASTADVIKPRIVPSANEEAVIVMWIFCLYFVWDLLTKAIVREADAPTSFLQRLAGGRMAERGWISLVCMVLAICMYFYLGNVTGDRAVLLADLALLSLVLLFRALKEKRWLIAFVLLVTLLGASVAAAAS